MNTIFKLGKNNFSMFAVSVLAQLNFGGLQLSFIQ